MSKEIINYKVNEKDQTTNEKKKVVKLILEDAGYNIEKYVLVRANNPGKILDLSSEENIHDGEQFLAVSKVPTPVSD